MELKNTFDLIGRVSSQDGIALVETNVTRMSRGKMATFKDVFPMHFASEKLKNLALKSKTARLVGRLQNNEFGDNYAICGFVGKVKSNTPQKNLARIQGEISLFTSFPAQPGKEAFGRLSLLNGENYLNAVVFRGLINKLEQTGSVGAGWEVVGRLSYRPFEDKNGNQRTSVDVAAQEARELYPSRIAAELDEADDLVAMGFSESEKSSTDAADAL